MTTVATPVSTSELDEDGLPVGTFRPGALLPGGVEAWERLGVGHRCETWLAWSPTMWGPVVAKFARPHQTDHPRARQSLTREVAALDGNLHPGLPRLYLDGTDADVPFVLLEYVDGPALDDELVDDADVPRPMTCSEVVLLAVQVLAALRSVHARGLVHVDLKPANLLLRNGRPVLVDFGSSRCIGASQPAGLLIGSPGYAAPELEAGAPIDPAMDTYGLGVVLHEALTGIPTFDPDLSAADRPAPAGLSACVISGGPAAGGAGGPAADVGALVHDLLRVDPAARPSTEQALRAFSALAAASNPESWPSWRQPNGPAHRSS